MSVSDLERRDGLLTDDALHALRWLERRLRWEQRLKELRAVHQAESLSVEAQPAKALTDRASHTSSFKALARRAWAVWRDWPFRTTGKRRELRSG